MRLAEEAFLAEFARLVAHLTERITGANDDGTPKVFRDSADRQPRRVLRAVPAAQRPVQRTSSTTWWPRPSGSCAGSSPQGLRDSDAPAQRVASELSRVQSSLDDLLVDRPRRRIVRSAAPAGGVVMQLVVTPRGRGPLPLRRGHRPGRARPIPDHPRQPRRARPRRPLARRPAPVGGPVLGPFDRRSEALEAERAWLEAHWLLPPG